MPGGSNGPIQYTGAPFQHPTKTMLQLRRRLIRRLGYSAQVDDPPPGMTELLTDFLEDAQRQLYKRKGIPERIMRWWFIPVRQGERHYDVPSISTNFRTDFTTANDGAADYIERATGSFLVDEFAPGQIVTIAGGVNDGTKVTIAAVDDSRMTFLETEILTAEAAGTSVAVSTVNYITLYNKKIEHVMIQQGQHWWELTEGISPLRYNEVGQSRPQNYEWTGTLEIWPAPNRDYTIWIYGRFGLLPFEADEDVTTIDPDLVFLMALANAKAHYGQMDAGSIYQQLEVHLANIVAENHGNERYIPSPKRPYRDATRPRQV